MSAIIYINIFLLFLGYSSFYRGAAFLYSERHATGYFKFNVFLLALSASMACVGYSIMSLSPDMTVAFISSDFGLLGIDLYLFSEIILILNDLKPNPIVAKISYVIIPVAILADLIIFGHPSANRFVRYLNHTAYFPNEVWRHTFHNYFVPGLMVFMAVIAIIWSKGKKYTRERQFVAIAYVSNLILFLSYLPNMLRLPWAYRYPHISYTLGIVVAFNVFFSAAINYYSFFISINTLGDNIFTSLDTGLVVFSPDGKLKLINNYASELLDAPLDYDTHFKDLFDLPTNTGYLNHSEEFILRTNKSLHLTSSRTNKPCLINITAKTDNHGEPLYSLLAITDLTEENRLIEEARAADAAKSQFLSNMSHEIRTPINVINGMSELIIRESKDATVLTHTKNIENASKTLLTLINDILDFSRIESGHYEIAHEEYKLPRLIRNCYLSTINKTTHKHQDFILKIDPSLPSILIGDEIRNQQIITNLLSNATKYTQDYGSITFDLSGEFTDKKHNLIIAVSDNGQGIKEEDLPHIFEQFTRFDTDKNRYIEGNGLGMAIINSLLKRMNATIDIKSEYGQGSTFIVTLPQEYIDCEPIGNFSVEEADNDILPTAHHFAQFTAPNASILVVDDSPMNIDVVAGLLKHTKIKIDSSCDGYDALEKIQRIPYDIIFMDHMMPGLDGFQVLENIKRLHPEPNISTPIVMLTANAIAGIEEKCLKAGFNAYISKPIHPITLEETVIRFLPASKVIQEESIEVPANIQPLPIGLANILDVQSGLEHSAGETEFYIALLKKYISEDKSKLLDEYYNNEDWNNYRIVAHSLKGTSMTIGAPNLSALAKELEFAVKENNLAILPEKHPIVIAKYQELTDNLKKIFKND